MLAALRRSNLPLRFTRQRLFATVSNPQTLVEKIVQKYAVDLAPGSKVHSGDYVMIKPEHVYVYPSLKDNDVKDNDGYGQ